MPNQVTDRTKCHDCPHIRRIPKRSHEQSSAHNGTYGPDGDWSYFCSKGAFPGARGRFSAALQCVVYSEIEVSDFWKEQATAGRERCLHFQAEHEEKRDKIYIPLAVSLLSLAISIYAAISEG